MTLLKSPRVITKWQVSFNYFRDKYTYKTFMSETDLHIVAVNLNKMCSNTRLHTVGLTHTCNTLLQFYHILFNFCARASSLLFVFALLLLRVETTNFLHVILLLNIINFRCLFPKNFVRNCNTISNTKTGLLISMNDYISKQGAGQVILPGQYRRINHFCFF